MTKSFENSNYTSPWPSSISSEDEVRTYKKPTEISTSHPEYIKVQKCTTTKLPNPNYKPSDDNSDEVNVRNINLENLQKRYHYYYDRWLNSYQIWKSTPATSDRYSTAKQNFDKVDNKMKDIKHQIMIINSKTEDNIKKDRNTIINQNKDIFKQEKQLLENNNNLENLSDRLSTSEKKIKDYQILNRSFSIKVFFWIILTIIIIIAWFIFLTKFYKLNNQQ